MEEKEILSKVANTILNQPVTITIDILKRSWLARFLKRRQLSGIKKKLYDRFCVRTFEIKDAPLSTLIKISKELIDIDLKVFDSSNLLESN